MPTVVAVSAGLASCLGYLVMISTHVAGGGFSGPLCPRCIEYILLLDAGASFVLAAIYFKKGSNHNDEAKPWVERCALVLAARVVATALAPSKLGGMLQVAGLPPNIEQANAGIVPVVVAVIGLYDLFIARENLWGRRSILPESCQFIPGFGKAVLVLDINRMLGFYAFALPEPLWIAWVAFVLFAIVASAQMMQGMMKDHAYGPVMMAGCLGLLINSSASGVPLPLSGVALVASGAVVLRPLIAAGKVSLPQGPLLGGSSVIERGNSGKSRLLQVE